jgi:hypothetical protein
VNPQFQVLPKLFPTDLEDRPTLAEMEVLQCHTLHQFTEIELGQLEQDVTSCFLVTLPLMLVWFVEALGPDLQYMASAVLVIVIRWSPPRERTSIPRPGKESWP